MPEILPLGGPPRLIPAGALPVAPAMERRIAALWRQAVTLRPSLFDGPILSLVRLDGTDMVLARACYRHLMAARQDPEIRDALQLRPLAVSGILRCADGIVFGRRADDVTQGGGLWELVPSGGVEAPSTDIAPDLAAAIMQEVHEELGLNAAEVTVMPPVGLVQDEHSGVVDVVMPLHTRLDGRSIQERHARHANREYSTLYVTSTPDSFAERADVMAESRLIAQHWATPNAARE